MGYLLPVGTMYVGGKAVARKGGEVIPLKPRRRRPKLWPWLLFLGIFILLVGVLLLYIPVFTLQEIRVVGNEKLTKDDLICLSSLEMGTNLLHIKTQQLKEWIKVSPWVKEVSVRKIFPDKLSLEIRERTPYFLLPYYTSFLFVAEDGTILGPAPGDLREVTLPILTGIKIEDPALPGQSLYCQGWDSLIDVLESIPSDFPLVIVEVNLSGDKELVLYTSEGIQILLGQAVDVSRKLALIEGVCREVNGPLQTINVRNGKRAHVALKQYGAEIKEDLSPDLGKNGT